MELVTAKPRAATLLDNDSHLEAPDATADAAAAATADSTAAPAPC